jgi:hypothetical protein
MRLTFRTPPETPKLVHIDLFVLGMIGKIGKLSFPVKNGALLRAEMNTECIKSGL